MVNSPVTVRVPATTANLGPGFDCLGMALDLWNQVQVSLEERPSVSVQGQGAGELPEDRDNLVYRAVEHLYQSRGMVAPGLTVRCRNEIPLERGLGSSAAAIVGGLLAANLLMSRASGDGEPRATLSLEELLELAVYLEGHPDNVAAALYGGMRLVAQEGPTLLCSPVPVPEEIHAVLFIPETRIATEDARAVLPDSFSRSDAVYNAGRVGLLVNAMATGRLEDVIYGTQDRIHQPYRQRLFPAMKVIFAGALKGGALGVFLSGSGSTVMALTRGREMTVAYEMAEAARQASVAGDVKITRPSLVGAHEIGGAAETPTRERVA